MFEVNQTKLPVFYQNLIKKVLPQDENSDYLRVIVMNNNEFEEFFYGAFSSEKNVFYKPISRILNYENETE
jgi:hypothetical protein